MPNIIIGKEGVFQNGFTPTGVPTNGLVSYWNFDGNTQDQVGSFDGVINGSMSYKSSGITNQALDSQGGWVQADYSVGDPIDVITNFSTSIWLKQDVSANTVIWETLAGNAGWHFQEFPSGEVSFGTGGSGGTGGGGPGDKSHGRITSSINTNDGNWHHFVGTYDGADVRLYVDGVLEETQPVTPGANSTGLQWGSRQGIAPFDGLIDECRFYTQVLTSQEVTDLYNADV